MHPSYSPNQIAAFISAKTYSMFVCLVADGWCWFVLREKNTVGRLLVADLF
jgi:hypothetical protein